MGMKVDVVRVGRTMEPLDALLMVCNYPKTQIHLLERQLKISRHPFHGGSLVIRSVGVFSKFRQTGVFFLWGLDVIGSLLEFQEHGHLRRERRGFRRRRRFGGSEVLTLKVQCVKLLGKASI